MKRPANQEHRPEQISDYGSKNTTRASADQNPERTSEAEHGSAHKLIEKAFIKTEMAFEDKKLFGGHQCNQPRCFSQSQAKIKRSSPCRTSLERVDSPLVRTAGFVER